MRYARDETQTKERAHGRQGRLRSKWDKAEQNMETQLNNYTNSKTFATKCRMYKRCKEYREMTTNIIFDCFEKY